MIIKVRAFAYFREILGRELDIELKEGSNIGDLLEAISEVNSKLKNALFDSSGNLKDYVVLMKNRKNIDSIGGLAAELNDGDEIALFPPVAGG